MRIRNVSKFGDLDVPLLGTVVLAGKTVEVTAPQARRLLEQPTNWAPVVPPKTTKAAKTTTTSDPASGDVDKTGAAS